jgi:hypothetical protein
MKTFIESKFLQKMREIAPISQETACALASCLELCNWGRIIHQNEYRRLHQSHKDRLSLSAAERYLNFVKQFPDVCQRCNLGYIASYIGITQPTLSRLRSKFLYSNGRI